MTDRAKDQEFWLLFLSLGGGSSFPKRAGPYTYLAFKNMTDWLQNERLMGGRVTVFRNNAACHAVRENIFYRLYERRNWFEVTLIASDIFECSTEETRAPYFQNFNFNWRIQKDSIFLCHQALPYL